MKINFLKLSLLTILLFALVSCPNEPEKPNHQNGTVVIPKMIGPVDFDKKTIEARKQIVKDCNVVGGKYSYGRVVATSKSFVPLLWTSVEGYCDDPEGVTGSLPVPGWISYLEKGRVAIWGGQESFFGSGADGLHDNDLFRKQFFDWLVEGKSKVSFSRGHEENFRLSRFSDILKNYLSDKSVLLDQLDGAFDSQALADCEVLVIGNPLGLVTEAETLALQAWVKEGGSLLVIKLGWAWFHSNPQKDSLDYGVNQIGKVFGWEAKRGGVKDFNLAKKYGESSSYTVFEVEPIEHYHPVKIKTYSIEDSSTNQEVKIAEKGVVKRIKGEYAGLYLFAAEGGVNFWAELNNPVEVVKKMDRAIKEQMKLVGNRTPYRDMPIWYSYVIDSDAPFYMHSGNPVIFKMAASRRVIEYFNMENTFSWGFIHENGHNMVAKTCGDNMVLKGGGQTEAWANVFTVLTYDATGWEMSNDVENIYEAGEKYHTNPNADPDKHGNVGIEKLNKDAWILLGCLNLIMKEHGKNGMKDFLKNIADDFVSGTKITGDIDRMDYTVLKMSQAYEINLVSLFQHWGYSVKETTISSLSSLPKHNVKI